MICAICGPFFWHGLTSIHAWIRNYIHDKMCDENTYAYQNFNGTIVEVWKWISDFTPRFTGFVITPPCWDSNWTLLIKGAPDRQWCFLTWFDYNRPLSWWHGRKITYTSTLGLLFTRYIDAILATLPLNCGISEQIHNIKDLPAYSCPNLNCT